MNLKNIMNNKNRVEIYLVNIKE